MYWLILAVPDSPSFCSSESRGTTTVISWRMIDAVTYGMIPSANSENWDSAPPEKRLSRLKIPPVLDRYWSIASESTPGAGIHDPSR